MQPYTNSQTNTNNRNRGRNSHSSPTTMSTQLNSESLTLEDSDTNNAIRHYISIISILTKIQPRRQPNILHIMNGRPPITSVSFIGSSCCCNRTPSALYHPT